MIQPIRLMGLYPKELKAGSDEIFAHPRSQQDCSQQPKGGSNLSVHQRMMDEQNVVYPSSGISFLKKE